MINHSLFTNPDAHVHIIGIGGAGMSAIARLLLDSGVQVSGSDRQANDITHALQKDGATIYEGHDAAHISGATVVLASSAVKADNPELAAARAAGIPILDRREAFPYLLPGTTQIAVAGTHGKTTTTALIVHLLRETGHDPSYIVGGVMLNTGDNAHAGKGSAFVVEADEYGGMFLGLTPQIAVITNIEHDHPDIFPTMDDVIAAFRQFVARIPDDGILIVCADDPQALSLGREQQAVGKLVVTYGLKNTDADWVAVLDQPAISQTFTVRTPLLRLHELPVSLPLPGWHNALNALAALAAVHAYGVSPYYAVPAISTFQGTGRRFEIMGQTSTGKVTVISDYAHHPTAIRATLQGARQRYGDAHIWAVWQPHTYSRTRLLANEFAHAFGDANHVLITDIYAAREQTLPGAPSGSELARLVAATGHPDARYSGDLDSTTTVLQREVQPNDVVIIFSAGDAPQIGTKLLRILDPH